MLLQCNITNSARVWYYNVTSPGYAIVMVHYLFYLGMLIVMEPVQTLNEFLLLHASTNY